MQNDLKYGKLSEICGINGYRGKTEKKSRRQNFPQRGRKCIHFFKGGGRKNSTLSKTILPCRYKYKVPSRHQLVRILVILGLGLGDFSIPWPYS